MDIKVVENKFVPNVFWDESKELSIQFAKEDAMKDPRWNTSKELTITLESFGSDVDEILVEWEFTK